MLDIEGFVSRKFADYKVVGNDIQVNCPFCEDRVGRGDTKRHMGISMTKQTAHCFRCEYSGSWIRLVMDSCGMSYAMALGELYVKPSMTLYKRKMGTIDAPSVSIAKGHLPDGFQLLDRISIMKKGEISFMKSAVRYMTRRGFSIECCRQYGLGVADSVPARVIIPIEDGYWQGRRIVPYIKPKYLNPKAESRAYLFNPSALELYDEVVVCEGAFSAMAIGDNAVALISKNPSAERSERLASSAVSKFIITIEPGAYVSMMPLADRLHRAGKEVIIWNYDNGDPADPKGSFKEYPYNLKNRVFMKLEAGNGYKASIVR